MGRALASRLLSEFFGNTGPLYGLPYFVFAAAGLFLVIDLIMRRSIAGRLVYALGGNPEAARIAGIRIELVRIGVYATSAALAAFAGVCYASQILVAEGNIGTEATYIQHHRRSIGRGGIYGRRRSSTGCGHRDIGARRAW